MNKDYYVLPKDDFLEVLIETAKENYLLNCIKEKSKCVREMIEDDTLENCWPETIECIELEIQCVKQMDNQKFLLHLLFDIEAMFLRDKDNDLQSSLYSLFENIVLSPKIFVDRG